MIARIKPSGFVHRWEKRAEAQSWGGLITRYRSSCRRWTTAPGLTIDFPPDTRRCPVCFPEGAGE